MRDFAAAAVLPSPAVAFSGKTLKNAVSTNLLPNRKNKRENPLEKKHVIMIIWTVRVASK